MPLGISIKLSTPFLGIVRASGGLLAALPRRLKIRHWIPVLNQWGDSYYGYVDCVHNVLLSLNQRADALLRQLLSHVQHLQSIGSMAANKKCRNV